MPTPCCSLSSLLPSSLIPPSKLSTFPSPRKLPTSPLLFSPSALRCRASTLEAIPVADVARPSFAEVARSVMELSSKGTLSSFAPEGWPLGIGARFVVDLDGCPALCLKNFETGRFSVGSKSSFHVQLQQSGLRTPQCTILGTLTKPETGLLLKDLQAKWERRFGEQIDDAFLYLVSVERVLCMADFDEAGLWVNSADYATAEPDPLRNFAEKLADEMNTKHSEDVLRLAHTHVETHFQVVGARMIWVDRLGLDLYVYSENEIFEARIPFPREVTDEKGVKSTFNCMSHQAWEVEKNYVLLESEKMKILKRVGPNV